MSMVLEQVGQRMRGLVGWVMVLKRRKPATG